MIAVFTYSDKAFAINATSFKREDGLVLLLNKKGEEVAMFDQAEVKSLYVDNPVPDLQTCI